MIGSKHFHKDLFKKSVILKYLHTISDYKLCELTDVNTGVSSIVYKLLNTDVPAYLRISESEDMWEKEADIYRLFEKYNIHTPKLLFQGKMDDIFFLITSEIKGAAVTGKSANIDLLLQSAGEELAVINSIKVGEFGYFDNPPFSTYQNFLFDNFRTKVESLTKLNLFSTRQYSKILDAEIKFKKLAEQITQPFLSHGDFGLPHIFEENGQYTGIIDFGDIRGASQFHDISHFYLYEKESYVKSLIKGFGKIVPLRSDLKDFMDMELLGIGISKLYWISQYASHRLGYKNIVLNKIKDLIN